MPPPGQPPYSPQAPTYPAGSTWVIQTPPRRGLRWWGWLLIIGGGLFVVCCGLGTAASLLRGAAGATTTQGRAGSATATQQPATVGSTITVNGVSCTLLDARIIRGDIYIKPDPGNVFVLVTVKLVNNSTSEFSYSPYSFNAESGTGNLRRPDIFFPGSASTSTPLRDGALAMRGSVEGVILFQIPEGDHQARLTWQPTIFSDKSSNAWLLGV